MKTIKKVRKVLYFIAEISSRKVWITFSVLTAIFILFGGIIYYFLDKRVENALAEQILHRQQVAVRSASISIHTFIENVEKSMVFMSQDSNVITMDKNSQKVLERYIEEWRGTSLVTVILVDNKGQILYSADNKNQTLTTQVNVSDREYFKLAMNANKTEVSLGQPIISRDIGGYSNQLILPFSVPLFENGEVKGILGVGILLSDLAREYLNPLKTSENSQIYFLNSQGIFIDSFYPELIGKNIDEVFGSIDFEGKDEMLILVKDILNSKEEGKVNLKLPKNLVQPDVNNILFSYSPVIYGNRTGLLAVGTPLNHINYFFDPISSIYILFIYLFISYIAISIIISLIILRTIQKISYIKGYMKAKKEK